MSVRDVIHDFAVWLQNKAYDPPKIKYYSHVEGMHKWAAPVPSAKFVPQWYKDLPKQYEFNEDSLLASKIELRNNAPQGIPLEFGTQNHTIKSCPGMQDILTVGYTVPMWSNAIVTVTMDGKQALSHTATNEASVLGLPEDACNGDFCKIKTTDPNSEDVYAYLHGIGLTEDQIGDWRKFQSRPETNPNIKVHPVGQYSTMVEHFPDEWAKCLLKLETPWRISTPPGWSVLYTDPTYQFNTVVQAMPGILNTDYWHESNMFFFIKKRGVIFSLNYGEPLVTHIPIKRSKLPLEVRMWNEEERQREIERSHFMNALWQGSKAYRKALSVLGYEQKKGECPFHKK